MKCGVQLIFYYRGKMSATRHLRRPTILLKPCERDVLLTKFESLRGRVTDPQCPCETLHANHSPGAARKGLRALPVLTHDLEITGLVVFRWNWRLITSIRNATIRWNREQAVFTA